MKQHVRPPSALGLLLLNLLAGVKPGYLVKLGMTALEAIEASTATGPLTLGPQAPRSGQLADGYDADVITLDADPLADIGVLADPHHVTGVWTGAGGSRRNLTGR